MSVEHVDGYEIVQPYPLRVLGVVSLALAGMHWLLQLSGALAVVTSLAWLAVTLSLAAILPAALSSTSRASGLSVVARMGATIFALSTPLSAFYTLRRSSILLIPRCVLVSGLLLLGVTFGWLSLRFWGLLAPPPGSTLEVAAQDYASLLLALGCSAAALLFGLLMALWTRKNPAALQ